MDIEINGKNDEVIKLEKFKNLKEIVNTRYTQFGEKIAFKEKNPKTRKFENITYKKLKEDIDSLGTVLINKFNLKGEKIAVIGQNSYRWFVTYMATICGVGVIVPLDKELPANEILNLLKRSEAKCIVYADRKADVIESIKKDLPKDFIYINMDKIKSDEGSFSFDQIVKEGNRLLKKDKSYLKIKIDQEEFRVLLFTSGTTGTPKGVMISHKNLMANVIGAAQIVPAMKDYTSLSILPMHHTYECTADFLWLTSVGGTIGICEGLKYVAKDMQDIQPDILIAVPALIENLSKKIDKKIAETKKENLVKTAGKVASALSKIGIDFRRKLFKQIHESLGGNLKIIFCGAAPIDKEIIEKFENYGIIFLQGFGSTETAPFITGTRIKTRVAGTCGKAMYNTDVRIDLSQNENESSNIGEVIVKGDNVMMGYYKMPEETKKTIKNGWLYTGDLGYFDVKGNLVLTGRSKNVIVTSNGKKIFPEEIETILNRLDLVEESFVYGAKDEKDNLELVVTARVRVNEKYLEEQFGKDNIPSDEEVYKMVWNQIKQVNKTLVGYKAIKKLEIKKGEFAKTTTMKIRRFEEIKTKC